MHEKLPCIGKIPLDDRSSSCDIIAHSIRCCSIARVRDFVTKGPFMYILFAENISGFT